MERPKYLIKDITYYKFKIYLAYIGRQSARHTRCSARGKIPNTKGGQRGRETTRYDDGT